MLESEIAGPTAPRALILDADGVVFETTARPGGLDQLTVHLADRLGRAGVRAQHAALRGALVRGIRSLHEMDEALVHRRGPREPPPEARVDVLTEGWDEAARAALRSAAREVTAELDDLLWQRVIRPGAADVIGTAARRGIPAALVGDAPAGHTRRALVATGALADSFAVQVYSEEVGVRKPHPRAIEVAATVLGVHPTDAWYLGTRPDRDVLAARRAGVGTVIAVTASVAPGNADRATGADATVGSLEAAAAVLRDARPPTTRRRSPRRGALLAARSGGPAGADDEDAEQVA